MHAAVDCPSCGKRIFDGHVVLCRVLRLQPPPAQAKCHRCRTWVDVPVVETEEEQADDQ
jgi:DNA-directed RNA polymerase subunit RPC12/RpoP